MPLAFKDFAPEVAQHARVFKPATYEQLQETVDRANAWLQDEEVRLINIETVVLPNIHNPGEEGTTDPDVRTSGEFSAHWHQFVRVWYENTN